MYCTLPCHFGGLDALHPSGNTQSHVHQMKSWKSLLDFGDTISHQSTTDYLQAIHKQPVHKHHLERNDRLSIMQSLMIQFKCCDSQYMQFTSPPWTLLLGFQHKILLSFPQLSSKSGSCGHHAISSTPLQVKKKILILHICTHNFTPPPPLETSSTRM